MLLVSDYIRKVYKWWKFDFFMKREKNYDLRNWFFGTVVAGAVPLLLFGGSRSVSSVSSSVGGVEKKVVCSSRVGDCEKGMVYSSGVASCGEKECVGRASYTSKELNELRNILYGEAANQSSRGRKFVARMILNRVRSLNYPNSVHDVVYDRNAFSCIFDKKNKNWAQATGELPRNNYENMVYGKCGEDARAILNGERLGVDREDEIVAYHDVSITKPKDKYWNSLESVEGGKVGRLIFYAPKKN